MPEVRVKDDTKKKHNLKALLKDWMDYVELSRYLFGTDNPIYDINEMPTNNKFRKTAMSIAKKMGVKWKDMTHEQSNRIMLALLEEKYRAMAEVCNKDNIMLEVKLKILNG